MDSPKLIKGKFPERAGSKDLEEVIRIRTGETGNDAI